MSARHTQRSALFLATAAIVLCPAVTPGVGFRLPNQDPEAIARGNAFVATADNGSAIYYNPAGITQLEGMSVQAGIYAISAGVDFTSPTGAKASVDSAFKPVPQMYCVYTPEDSPLSFGLGMYAPYGLSLDWGTQNPFRTAAEKGELVYLSLNPVIAWKIHPALSIGIGPTINYSEANVERGIGFIPGDEFKVAGTGWDYGFNAGVRWQPHPMWAFGLNYRHPTTIDYDGTAETHPTPPYPGVTSSSASIHFPQFVVAGISFRPTENWNFEFDIDWTDWDSVKEIVIRNTAFGNQVWPLNYRSSLMYEFGVTRQLGRGYFASLGYFYSENSSPDAYFNPIIPDSDLHLGSVGVGHHGKRWNWAAAYHFGYNPDRTVTHDVAFPSANGRYEILNHAFNVSATIKF